MRKSGDLFDSFSQDYDRYRPSYPAAIVHDGLKQGTKILEVGAGTGHLTKSLIRSQAYITAIEPGKHLAAILRNKIRNYQLEVLEVRLVNFIASDFYDVVLSAQAFHWIDFDKGLDMIHKVNVANGTVGILWRVYRSDSTEFFQKSKPIYSKYYQDENVVKSMSNMSWIFSQSSQSVNILSLDWIKDIRSENSIIRTNMLDSLIHILV